MSGLMRPFNDGDLHAFVDGQLDPERRDGVSAFLKSAPEDAARVEAWRRQNEALRSLFVETAPDAVPSWLTLRHITAEKSRPLSLASVREADRSARAPGRGRLAAAPLAPLGRRIVPACLFAFVTGVLAAHAWPPTQAREPAESRLVATAQSGRDAIAGRVFDAHKTFTLDASRPVEILDTPPGTLARWFDRHVAFPVVVPDLHSLGWTLRGGRVVPGDLGPASLLVYEDALGERLSVFAGRQRQPHDPDSALHIDLGGVLTWVDGDLVHGLASSKPAGWLEANAPTLERLVSTAPDRRL